jgi:hypothetical protein
VIFTKMLAMWVVQASVAADGAAYAGRADPSVATAAVRSRSFFIGDPWFGFGNRLRDLG